MFAAVVDLCIQNSKLRIFLNLFCEVVCCIELTRTEEEFPWFGLWHYPMSVRKVVYPFSWLCAAIFFFLLEIDRVSGESTVVEARQLRKGYAGSIQYAQCARQSDAAKIHREIEDQQDAVDFAIHVLLTAGMSTPALRHIAEAGVDIEFAAYSEITAAAILLVPYQLLSAMHFAFHIISFQGDWPTLILQGISILGRFILLVMLFRNQEDEQCFLLKLLTKFTALLAILLVLCLILVWLPDTKPVFVWLVMTDLGLLCLIPMAILGIQGTAERLPLGRRFVQLIFARGTKAFAACRSSFRPKSTESSSESTGEIGETGEMGEIYGREVMWERLPSSPKISQDLPTGSSMFQFASLWHANISSYCGYPRFLYVLLISWFKRQQ